MTEYQRVTVTTREVKYVYNYKPLKHPLSVLREIERRQQAGDSNRQIGRDLGIDPQCLNRLIAKWRRGKNPPKPEPEPATVPKEEPAEEPKNDEDPELEAYIADLLGPSGL